MGVFPEEGGGFGILGGGVVLSIFFSITAGALRVVVGPLQYHVLCRREGRDGGCVMTPNNSYNKYFTSTIVQLSSKI